MKLSTPSASIWRTLLQGNRPGPTKSHLHHPQFPTPGLCCSYIRQTFGLVSWNLVVPFVPPNHTNPFSISCSLISHAFFYQFRLHLCPLHLFLEPLLSLYISYLLAFPFVFHKVIYWVKLSCICRWSTSYLPPPLRASDGNTLYYQSIGGSFVKIDINSIRPEFYTQQQVHCKYKRRMVSSELLIEPGFSFSPPFRLVPFSFRALSRATPMSYCTLSQAPFICYANGITPLLLPILPSTSQLT